VTESALVTQRGIEMALRQPSSTGRHRRNSLAATSQITPVHHHTALATAGRTTPRHRKAPQAAGRTTPRHRKAPQAAGRTTPRHRKKGRGHTQATYPRFRIGQDNSIRIATRRVALPGAFALGLLAVGGAITGAFSTTLPGVDRAGGDPGGMTSALMPSLTAMSTPSSDAAAMTPARADRGLRGPVDASAPAAWPISEQAGTAGVTGNGDARQPAQTGTTTIVRDRAAEPDVFAPTVTADPSGGHGGGGGPAESSVQPEPPAAGGGELSGVFGPGGLLNGLAGGPGDSSDQRVDDRPDLPRRADRPGPRRIDGPGDAGGAGRGFARPGKTSDGGNGDRGNDGQTGGGGQHRGR
jgi:hypothetical protein